MPKTPLKKAVKTMLTKEQLLRNRRYSLRRRASFSGTEEFILIPKTRYRRHSINSFNPNLANTVVSEDVNQWITHEKRRRTLQTHVAKPHIRFFKDRFVKTGALTKIIRKFGTFCFATEKSYGICIRTSLALFSYALTGDEESVSTLMMNRKLTMGRSSISYLSFLKKIFHQDIFTSHIFSSRTAILVGRPNEPIESITNFSKIILEMPPKSVAFIVYTSHGFTILREKSNAFVVLSTDSEEDIFAYTTKQGFSNAMRLKAMPSFPMFMVAAEKMEEKINDFLHALSAKEKKIQYVCINNGLNSKILEDPNLEVQLIPRQPKPIIQKHTVINKKIQHYFKQPFPAVQKKMRENTFVHQPELMHLTRLIVRNKGNFFLKSLPHSLPPHSKEILATFHLLIHAWTSNNEIQHIDTQKEKTFLINDTPAILLGKMLGLTRARTGSFSIHLNIPDAFEAQQTMNEIASSFGHQKVLSDNRHWRSVTTKMRTNPRTNDLLRKRAMDRVIDSAPKMLKESEKHQQDFYQVFQEQTPETILNTLAYASSGKVFMLLADEKSFFISKDNSGNLLILKGEQANNALEPLSSNELSDKEIIQTALTVQPKSLVTLHTTLLYAQSTILLEFKDSYYPKKILPGRHESTSITKYFTDTHQPFTTDAIDFNKIPLNSDFKESLFSNINPHTFNVNFMLNTLRSKVTFNQQGKSPLLRMELDWKSQPLSAAYLASLSKLILFQKKAISYMLYSKKTFTEHEAQQRLTSSNISVLDDRSQRNLSVCKLELTNKIQSITNLSCILLIVDGLNAFTLTRDEISSDIHLIDKEGALEKMFGNTVQELQHDAARIPGFYKGRQTEIILKKIIESQKNQLFELIQMSVLY